VVAAPVPARSGVTAFLAGLAVAAAATLVAFTVVLVRWHVRDRRRRSARFTERLARKEDIERSRRRLRLNVGPL
jgi:Flp pilus assembly protein TadB